MTGKKNSSGEKLGEYCCPKGWHVQGAYSMIDGTVLKEYGLRCITTAEHEALLKL